MSDIEINANGNVYPVQYGDLWTALQGVWTSHLVLTGDVEISGTVSLNYHGTEFAGFVERLERVESNCHVVIVGGKGGLARDVPAQFYDFRNTFDFLVRQLLGACGEDLDTLPNPTLHNGVDKWARIGGIAGRCMDDLAAMAGASWRVLPNGRVFFGGESWLPSQLTSASWIETKEDCAMRDNYSLAYPIGTAKLFPGETFNGRKVARVCYVDDGEWYTARVWYTVGDSNYSDPIEAGIRALIAESFRQERNAFFGARVVSQRGDGTLDLMPDQAFIPPMTSVPIMMPIPGARLTLNPNARCRVFFTDGDFRMPHVLGFEPGSAQKALGVDGDQVNCGTLTLSVAANVLTGSYADPFGASIPVVAGQPFALRGKLIGSSDLRVP